MTAASAKQAVVHVHPSRKSVDFTRRANSYPSLNDTAINLKTSARGATGVAKLRMNPMKSITIRAYPKAGAEGEGFEPSVR